MEAGYPCILRETHFQLASKPETPSTEWLHAPLINLVIDTHRLNYRFHLRSHR